MQEREYQLSDEILIKNSAHDKYEYEHIVNPNKKVEVLDFVSIEETPRKKR
jgi:hypothetical protein